MKKKKEKQQQNERFKTSFILNIQRPSSLSAVPEIRFTIFYYGSVGISWEEIHISHDKLCLMNFFFIFLSFEHGSLLLQKTRYGHLTFMNILGLLFLRHNDKQIAESSQECRPGRVQFRMDNRNLLLS